MASAESWNDIRERIRGLEDNVNFLLANISTVYIKVNTYADLPSPSLSVGEVYLVRQTTGTIPFRKHSGLWRSDGGAWYRLGRDADPVSIKARYESNVDTNVYSDAEKIKLANLTVPMVYTQTLPSMVWNISHNAGQKPVVQTIDSTGKEIIGAISWPDLNTVVVEFSTAIAGEAFLVW